VASQIDGLDRFTNEQMDGILEFIKDKDEMAQRWEDKRIIRLCDDKVISIKNLVMRAKIRGKVFYGENDQANSRANDLGWVIVPLRSASEIDRILLMYGLEIQTTNAARAPELAPIYGEGYKEFKRNTKQEKIISKALEKILENSDDIRPRTVLWGKGPAGAWTDGRNTVWFDREIWKEKIKDVKKGGAFLVKAILDMSGTLIHEMAHDTDDRGAVRHGTSTFMENFEERGRSILNGMSVLFQDDKFLNPMTGEYESLAREKSLERLNKVI
jgi:hypothetical protein